MPNDYDTIVGQVLAAKESATEQVASTPAEIHPAYEAFAENAVDRLRVVTSAGLVQDPARAGRIRSLQARTRLPADLIDHNLDAVELDARAADFDPEKYRTSSPRVAAWLAEQPEHLAISLDDLPRLAAVERFIADSPDYAWDKGGGILGPVVAQGETGSNRPFYRTTADLLREMKRRSNLAAVDEVQRQMRAEAARDRGPFAAGFITAGGSTLRVAQSLGDLLTGQDRASATARQVAQIGEASAINNPGFIADVQRGIGGLTADAPLMLAGAALAPLTWLKRTMGAGKLAAYGVGAATAAIASQPLAIREGILTGIDEGWANGLASWGIETVVPAAFGSTGSERIVTSLLNRGVAKPIATRWTTEAARLLADAGWEATEEAVTEAVHAMHEVASGINPDALTPGQLWPRLAVAATVGGIAGAGFNLPGTVLNLSKRGNFDRDAQRILSAMSAEQTLTTVMDAAAQSAVAGRSPEAARELFQSMVADKVPQVWVDREAWDKHFQGQNVDPRAKAAELIGDQGRSYDEAARTGVPLRIDTGTLAVGLATDKTTSAWITKEARLDPQMMNGREKDEMLASLETMPDDPEQKAQQTAQEAAQAVQDDVEQQLTTAGYSAPAARRSAVQMAAVFRTLAARWNAGRKADDPSRMDAKRLYQDWNIGINRPVADILASPGRQTPDQILAAQRARLSDMRLAKVDETRRAAQEAADKTLAQEAAGEPGSKIIDEARAILEAEDTAMGIGDAMRALGADFGFRPDAFVKITPEQTARGNLFAAALRVRGMSLASLIADTGRAKVDPTAATAKGVATSGYLSAGSVIVQRDSGKAFTVDRINTSERGSVAVLRGADGSTVTKGIDDLNAALNDPKGAWQHAKDNPEVERLTADALRLRDLVSALRADRGDLAELEQATALAQEIGPQIDRLGLSEQTAQEVRAAVAFVEDDRTLNQDSVPPHAPMTDAEAKSLVDHFGTTNNISEAGYILPDGRMLDFSGRHQMGGYQRVGDRWIAESGQRDYQNGERQVDHREIPSEITPAQGGDAINWMLERGAIRIDAKSGSVHTAVVPNAKQLQLVRLLIDMNNGEVGIDLNDGGFRDTGFDFRAPMRRFDRYYDRGTKPIKIIGHMRRFFSGENLDADTLFQRKSSAPRGSITFGRRSDGTRQTDIRLFQGADLSTVLHESGHLYLEMIADLAAREGAPADIIADRDILLNWLGITSVDQIGTKQHEQMARGYEAYLREGKAPSAELRGAFARFASWLAFVYKSIKALAVDLTPEVRGVFDRLLATQEEIAEARSFIVDDPIFADAAAAGMTPDQFATYQRAREEAVQRANDDLRTQLMTEMKRETDAAAQEIRDEVRKEVTAEVNRAREYVAESMLRRGELPGGVPLPPGSVAIKLDSKDLRRRIDNKMGTKAERESAMKRFAMMHTRSGGMGVDEAAAVLGFDSGDALLNAMANLRPRKELIEAETTERMRARFGDSLTDGTVAEKAMLALHNERKADVHLMEVKALATRIGKKVAPIEVLREAARKKIDGTAPKDISPGAHLRAEAKARRTLEAALAKQDFAAAFNAKQQEMLAHEMYRAAVEAKREVEQIVNHAKKFNEKKTREKIGKAGGWEWTVTKPDGNTEIVPTEDAARELAAKITGARWERTSGYLEQIDGLMERYEFRRTTNRALANRQSLKEWAAERQAAGQPVNIPPEVLEAAQRRNYRSVPLSELRGVSDALANIAHLAKKKNELSKALRERELDATAAELAATLARTYPKEVIAGAAERDTWGSKLPEFIAAHRKAANVARQMDGDEDNGPFWNALIRPINEAADAEARMLREAKEKQDTIWKRWRDETSDDGWPADELREFSGFHKGLDRLGAIMVALNWGNEGNRDRLKEGGAGQGKLTDAQVYAVLDSLNAADWNLVEDIWQHIDSYWPEIKALEQRTTGVPPGKVDPSPFPTKHGTIKGGYFPIIYDGKAESGRIDGEATDLAKQMQAQAFGRTQTARGHTKERSIGQGRRLKLDPASIGTHLTKVIHDLTHREALADTLRVLLHDDVRTAIDRRMGVTTTKNLKQWIADIATGGTPPDAAARFAGYIRRGFSISTMGYRTMSAAIQLTGFANSAVRVGPARMAKAIATLFSARDGQAAWNWVAEQSPMMRERGNTMSREITELASDFQRTAGKRFLNAVQFKAFWMMQQVQGVVDRATWLAAYDKALADGIQGKDAVAVADQAVIDTQSGGQTKDLSGVQRSPFGNTFTGAYTWGAMLFNQLYDQGARIRRNPKDFGTWASATGNMMLAAALPTALTVILRAALRGDWPDDDDDKDGYAKRLGNEFAATILGTMIGFREAGGIFDDFGYRGPAVTKPIGDAYRLAGQIKQGDIDEGMVRATLDVIGSGLGLPSGQAWATGKGLYEWLEDPSPDIRPIIFGPPPKR